MQHSIVKMYRTNVTMDNSIHIKGRQQTEALMYYMRIQNQEYGADNPINKSGQHGDSEHTRKNYEITKKKGLLLYLLTALQQ
jgi:hypothetical protein